MINLGRDLHEGSRGVIVGRWGGALARQPPLLHLNMDLLTSATKALQQRNNVAFSLMEQVLAQHTPPSGAFLYLHEFSYLDRMAFLLP